MVNPAPHDVRLVYLACAWLVAHRGHFLSEVNQDNIAGLTDFHAIWTELLSYISSQDTNVVFPWKEDCEGEIRDILKTRSGITAKNKQLCHAMFVNGKCPKEAEGFPYRCDQFLKALCGGKISAEALFGNASFAEIQSFP